jgi:microcystin-dependent protein
MTNPVCNFPTVALELQAKDDDLQNQITQEISARIDADNQLQSNIDIEANTRSAADQELQDKISNEVVARTDADNVLQTNINTEIDTRKNVDQGLQEQIDALNISGTVQYFARQTAPEGWLKADGSAISRNQYANLFAAVGTMFGSGDGSATFNLPDLRGEFIRGLDDVRGVDSGRILGSRQDGSIQSHDHTLLNANGNTNTGVPENGNVYNGDISKVTYFTKGTNTCGWVLTSAAGSSETRPRNVALLACIKY